MMFNTMAHPPRQGSLLELLFTMIQMRRETEKVLETFVVIQAVRDNSDSGEATSKAFDDYRNFLIPHLASGETEVAQSISATLANEFSRGPMKIKAIDQPSTAMRSKLRKTVEELRSVPRPTLRWKRRR
jgi:hypothetical protein